MKALITPEINEDDNADDDDDDDCGGQVKSRGERDAVYQQIDTGDRRRPRTSWFVRLSIALPVLTGAEFFSEPSCQSRDAIVIADMRQA